MDPNKYYYSTHTPSYYHSITSTPNTYQQYTKNSPHTQQQYHNNTRYINTGSKISELNEQLSKQTEMLKIRNQIKRQYYDRKSGRSNSRESRRSYGSNGQRQKLYKQYGGSSYYGGAGRYLSDNQSLTSSRASNQMLRRPIIAHNIQIQKQKQPGFFYHEQPTFNKYRSQQPQYNTVLTKPILQQQNYHSTMSQNKPKFQSNPSHQINNNNRKTQQNDKFYDINQKKQQSFSQFLDMDFNKNPNIKQTNPQPQQIVQQQSPVSPVTYFLNINKQTTKNGDNQSSYQNTKLQKQSSQSFSNRIKNMLLKIDYDGKIITIALVGLAILLVIIQLIR